MASAHTSILRSKAEERRTAVPMSPRATEWAAGQLGLQNVNVSPSQNKQKLGWGKKGKKGKKGQRISAVCIK